MHAFTQVDGIDSDQLVVFVKGVAYPDAKLVLATGANTFVPPMLGNATDKVITLNSLREFDNAQLQLQNAQGVLVTSRLLPLSQT